MRQKFIVRLLNRRDPTGKVLSLSREIKYSKHCNYQRDSFQEGDYRRFLEYGRFGLPVGESRSSIEGHFPRKKKLDTRLFPASGPRSRKLGGLSLLSHFRWPTFAGPIPRMQIRTHTHASLSPEPFAPLVGAISTGEERRVAVFFYVRRQFCDLLVIY